MTRKPETLDCVDVKRRAQRKLAKALAGKTPEEQVETLRRMADQSPLWKKLEKARPEGPRKAVRTPGKRRSTG
jgi:hypothetical protein